ncbi:MAG: TonB family protein [Pseudomonadota bacterium]
MTDAATVPVEDGALIPLGRVAELTVCAAIAIALHLFIASWMPDTGAPPAGPPSEASVAMKGASGEVAALIEAWETAPDASEAPADLVPAAIDEPPATPSDVEVPPQVSATPMDLLQSDAPAPAPQVERFLRDPVAETRAAPSGAPTVPAGALPTASVDQSSTTPLLTPAPIVPDTAATPPDSPEAPPPPPEEEVAVSESAAAVAPLPAVRPEEVPARRRAPSPTRAEPRTTAEPPSEPSLSEAGAAGGAAPSVGSPEASESANAAPTPAAGLSEPQRLSLMRAYGAEVQAAIARERRYPRRSQARREEGVARLTVTIDRAGRLIGSSVSGSSGHARLDEAAIAAATAVGRFPQPPSKLAGERFVFTIPIRFAMR